MIMFFLFATIQMYGQQPSLRFSHLTAADGLPYSLVTKIHKAANNVVWISTWDGLYYFDGKKVKKFPLPDSNKNFFGGWTNYIVESNQNDIYVGSVKGLMVINSVNLAATIIPLYKKNNRFTSYYTEPLSVDGKNNLWLFTGYNRASLYRLRLKDKALQFVVNDVNGVLLVIEDKVKQSPAGMWYRENKGAYYASVNSVGAKISSSFLSGKRKDEPMLYVNAVVARDTTQAWLATRQGLFYANRMTNKIKKCNLGSSENNVKSMAQSKNGLLYCATGTNGILVYDPITDKVTTSYRHYDQDLWSISGNNVEYIYIDDRNHLFAAVANQGISYADLNDSAQTYYKLLSPKKEPALSFNDRITAVAEKNNFGYYYVEEKGLFVCNKQMIVQKIIPDKYTGRINHMLPGNGDTVWTAAEKGLFYFLNSTLHSVPAEINNYIPLLYSVTILSDNRIIAAGEEGLYFCEKRGRSLLLKKFSITPKIEYPFFKSIFQYGDGKILLNTKSTSFYKAAIEGNSIKLLTETHAIDVVPLAYQKVSDSAILIGCTDGVYLYNTNSAVLQKKTPEKGNANAAFLFDKDKVFTLSGNALATCLIGDSLAVSDMQHIASGSYSPMCKTGSLEGISGTSGGVLRFNLEKPAAPYYYIFNGGNNANNRWHSLTKNADSLVL